MTAPAPRRARSSDSPARCGRAQRSGGRRSRWAPAALLLGTAAWAVRLGWIDAPYWVLAAWGSAAGRPGGCIVGRMAQRTAAFDRRHRRTARRARRLAPRHAHRPARSLGGGNERRRCWLWPIARRRTMSPRAARRPSRRWRAPFDCSACGGLGVLALGLAAFGSAGPLHGPAAALWHPRRAWEATVAPVRMRVGRQTSRSRAIRPRSARGVRPQHGDAVASGARRRVAAAGRSTRFAGPCQPCPPARSRAICSLGSPAAAGPRTPW